MAFVKALPEKLHCSGSQQYFRHTIQTAGLSMALKKNDSIPDDNHILRYISLNKLRKDENDKVIGILGEAFKLRNGESYLSANWLEYFTGSHDEQVTDAIKEFRKHFDVRSKAGFAIGNVDDIKAVCADKRNCKIHVVSYPTTKKSLDGKPYKNKSHVAVKSLPADDIELLELLATEAWCHLVLNNTVPS